MSNISVKPQATTISINRQTTKTFVTYTKTLVQFHRWNSTPPQFIYLDLHGSTPEDNSSRITLAHMIVYGVKGYAANVDPSVFDSAFVNENGKMLMETDIDMNNHRILNLSDTALETFIHSYVQPFLRYKIITYNVKYDEDNSSV